MSGFLFVTVHSPSRDPVREKNLGALFFMEGTKFGFGNSGIGAETVAFGALMH
jgi:hypothetical protein